MNKKIVFIIFVVLLASVVFGYSFFDTRQEAIIEFESIKSNSVDFLKNTVITFLDDGFCEIKSTNPVVTDCTVCFSYDYDKGIVVNDYVCVHYVEGSLKNDVENLARNKVEKELIEVLQPAKVVFKDLILGGAKI